MTLRDPPETGAHGADHEFSVPAQSTWLCHGCDAPRASPVAFCPDCGESTIGYELDAASEGALVMLDAWLQHWQEHERSARA